MDQYTQPPAQGARRVIWRWGFIGGAGIAVADLLASWLGNALDLGSLAGIPLLISLFFLVAAGLFAAERTGRIGPGLLAAVLAGIIAPVVELVLLIMLVVVTLIITLLGSSDPSGDSVFAGIELLFFGPFLALSALIFLVAAWVVRVILGLGLGALGAVIGKHFYEPAPEEPGDYEMEDHEPEGYSAARDFYRPASRYVPGGQYIYRQPPEDDYADDMLE